VNRNQLLWEISYVHLHSRKYVYTHGRGSKFLRNINT